MQRTSTAARSDDALANRMVHDVRVVVVDLDGVIRHWPRTDIDTIETRHGLHPGELFATAFERSLLRAAVTGEISDDQWRRTVAERLHLDRGVNGTAIVDAWTRSPARIDYEVLDLIDAHRSRRRTALLTNATTRLFADLEQLELLDLFDQVFNTAELGVAKPDPRCFEKVVARLGLHPHQVALIDDAPMNIEAASAFGMVVHHFTGVQALASFFASLDATVPSPVCRESDGCARTMAAASGRSS